MKFTKSTKDQFVAILSDVKVSIKRTIKKQGVFTAHVFEDSKGNLLARKLINSKTGNISYAIFN